MTEPTAVPTSAPDSSTKVASSIGRNTVFGIIGSAIQIGTRLITVPAVIAHVGLGGYGIWNILLTIMGYMRFGSIGIKSAFQKYVAKATGDLDYNAASDLLSTGTAGIALISLVLLIPASIYSSKIAALSGIPPEFLTSGSRAISLLALMMVLSNSASAYEATIMGGHRIDLTRTMGTILCLLEAVFILLVLRLGYGLAAMAGVMAVSQCTYVVLCFIMSRKVVPQIKVTWQHLNRSVVRELVRYAGSYQMVSVLQLTYGALAPIAILKTYGAQSSGVYALGNRLISPVSMIFFAFLVPVLSGGAMVYASNSSERIESLLRKSFKLTLAITVIPLTLLCAFGEDLVLAWTGQSDVKFGAALLLISAATIANCVALLGLVLYRASGKTVMDNLREIIRIIILLPVIVYARSLGFSGVLAGMAIAEVSGAVFMMFALKRTFPGFRAKSVLRDFARLAIASVILLAAGLLASHITHFVDLAPRLAATTKLAAVGVTVGLLAYPALFLTGSITKAETTSLMEAFRRRSRAVNPTAL